MRMRVLGLLFVLFAADVVSLPSIPAKIGTISDWIAQNELKSTRDAHKPVKELVEQNGFTYTPIDVTMMDGFICTMFRVVDPQVSHSKGPVILQHGILDSSDTWVLDEFEQSFGMLLARDGFDVFMTNNRGNKHCKRHSTLTTKDDAFWKFTWDEMASDDIPSFINFVLELTRTDKLTYIAHSQGTTQMFAALTTIPELRYKVRDFVALAPVSYVSHSTSGLLVELAKLRIDHLVGRFGIKEFLPDNAILNYALPEICNSVWTGWMCDWGMWMVTGYSWQEINKDRLPVYMAHFPSGTSVLNGIHWAQGIRSDHEKGFGKLDLDQLSFEDRTNMQLYGKTTPPQYQLTELPMDDVEITVFSGDLDPLANPTDVELMMKDLPKEADWVYLKGYDHMTFLWGKNAARDIYHPVIDHLNFKLIPAPEIQESVPLLKRQNIRSNGHSDVMTTFAFTMVGAAALAVLMVTVSAFSRRFRKRNEPRDVYQQATSAVP